jgi:HemY protein
LTRAGDVRRATRVLEAAWRAAPHPEIAEAYASVRPGDSVRDRLKRMRRLAELRANHPEGAIALARVAVDGREWAVAREALAGLVRAGPSERVCMLMAEIEEGEHGDQGRVRGWLTRAFSAPRDPAWVADGQAFDRWAPVSPISGRVDAFEWKVATKSLPVRSEIEGERETMLAAPAPRPAAEAAPVFAPAPAAVIIPPKPAAKPPRTDGASAPSRVEAATPGAGKVETAGSDAGGPASVPPRSPTPRPAGASEAGPRAPDDPGPEPATAEAVPPRRGFRLF